HYTARADVGVGELEDCWARLPSALRMIPGMIACYAEGLSRLGRGETAEKTLRQALKGNWCDELVLAYGNVRGADPTRQLKRAEQWLKAHAEDAALLLTTARLCMAVELWGKARSYLESSLAMEPRPAAYALYGQLLRQLGEEDDAAAAFRSGLALVTGPVTELPALGAPRAGAELEAGDLSVGESGATRANR
ncbi:MAG TPA: hypothetical protein VLD39_00800, partial [Gammaproteobacteria bacterium]|nr:hypothetical protein [Gammaproteobacteria bacterium]